jgi:hypothetical protein
MRRFIIGVLATKPEAHGQFDLADASAIAVEAYRFYLAVSARMDGSNE